MNITVGKHDTVHEIIFSRGETSYWVEIDEIIIFFKKPLEVTRFVDMVNEAFDEFGKVEDGNV